MAENIEVRGVHKVYGDGVETHALRGVDLVVAQAEFLALVGPSGSGKSTLLNLMGALDRPTRGDILLEGTSLAGRSEPQLAELRNRKIGFVFQFHFLLPELTALENVMMPILVSGTGSWPRARAVAADLLEAVGLSHRLDYRPAQLSGGEQQRVAIARALANQPTVVLADEPTGNIDQAASTAVIELMRKLNRERQTTFIIVTHDPSISQRTDRIVELVDGQIKSDRKITPS